MKPIQINEAAETDAEEATDWYLTHAERETADRFVEALQVGLRNIFHDPQTGFISERGTRSLILKRFPYRIVFREYDEFTEVFAVAHMRRSAYWMGRTKQEE